MTKEFNLKIDFIFWFLILLPTFYVINSDLRSSQHDFFIIACLLMVAMFHANKYIGMFLGWEIFQMIFLKHEGLVFIEDRIYALFLGAILYHFIFMYLNTENLKKYYQVFIGVMAFNVFWCFLQMKGIDPIWSNIDFQKQSVMTEFPGFFALPAFLGNYVAAVIPFCLGVFWPLIALAVIALWFSKSTFSVLAGAVAIGFYFWFKKRIVFWFVLAASLAAIAFYSTNDFKTGQFERRFNVWGAIIKEALGSQFYGHGFGSYGKTGIVAEVTPTGTVKMVHGNLEIMKFAHDEAAKKGQTELTDKIKTLNPNTLSLVDLSRDFQKKEMDIMFWNEAHNEYIQVLYDSGVVGVLIIFFYIFDVLKRFSIYGYRDDHCIILTGSFLAILIICAGHFPFQVARLAGPFLCIFAMLDRSLLNRKKAVV